MNYNIVFKVKGQPKKHKWICKISNDEPFKKYLILIKFALAAFYVKLALINPQSFPLN